MERKIWIPYGNGTSGLREIEQGWVKLASALLAVTESGEPELPEAVKDFARYVMFKSEDTERGAVDASLAVVSSLNELLPVFGSACVVKAIGFKPQTGGSHAAVHIVAPSGDAYGFWFSDVFPYAGLAEGESVQAEMGTPKRQKLEPEQEQQQQHYAQQEAPQDPRLGMPARLLGKKPVIPQQQPQIRRRPPAELTDQDLGIQHMHVPAFGAADQGGQLYSHELHQYPLQHNPILFPQQQQPMHAFPQQQQPMFAPQQQQQPSAAPVQQQQPAYVHNPIILPQPRRAPGVQLRNSFAQPPPQQQQQQQQHPPMNPDAYFLNRRRGGYQ